VAGKIGYPKGVPRVGKLESISDLAVEMRKLYRDARRGKIQTGTAAQLTYILNTLKGFIESSDLEKRVQAVEAQLCNPQTQPIKGLQPATKIDRCPASILLSST